MAMGSSEQPEESAPSRGGQVQRPVELDYPDRYRVDLRTKGGIEITLRPLELGDRDRLRALFATLSHKSADLRFGERPTEHTPALLIQLIELDRGRNITLAAIGRGDLDGQILGTARVITLPGEGIGEIAFLVGDPWQGKGIGAALFEEAMAIARARGLRTLWSIVPPTNTIMLEMASTWGFTVLRSRFTDAYDVIVSL